MEVTILSREWRWLLHTANESWRRSVTIAVTEGVASGAGPNLRELVSDRLFFLPGSHFKPISITFSTTYWRLRFHSSLRRLQVFFIDFLDSFVAYCPDVKVKCCYVFELVTKLWTIYFCRIATEHLFVPYPNFMKANSLDERRKVGGKKGIYFCQFIEVCNFVLLEFLCLNTRTTLLRLLFLSNALNDAFSTT